MEQASKRSSSHEGGLLLDPLHMRTRFSSVRKDVNGFPPRLIRLFPVFHFRFLHQAAPELEMTTGFPSQATTSNQSTDLLLQQLMAEMKYLRERVDTLPAGPVQGVAASLQTSQEVTLQNPVPNLFPLLRIWKMLSKQHRLIPMPLSLLDSWRPAPWRQTYRFPRLRIFVRWSGNMSILRFAPYRRRAPPWAIPNLCYLVLWLHQGLKILVFPAKALAALPPSPSVIDCCKLLCNTATVSWPYMTSQRAFSTAIRNFLKRPHNCVPLFMLDCVMPLPSRVMRVQTQSSRGETV
jgi:hypothetical protein